MRRFLFVAAILIFCFFRLYYNLIEVVPKWLNDSYFSIESLIVVLLIASSKQDKEIRTIGLWGSIGSFLYFVLRQADLFRFEPIGEKYFVPGFIMIGFIFGCIKLWQRYQ